MIHERGGFSCTVTGADGFEPEILRLRNANREWPETIDYITWRYQRAPAAPDPLVFWLISPDGQRIGMASAVFRPYWVREVSVQTAVIGDISLDSRWRGRGLGQLMLRFMTNYLDEHFPEQPAFVIPTEAARKTLAHIGWLTAGTLVPHVYVLDFTRYVVRMVRNEWFASSVARQIRRLARLVLKMHIGRDDVLDLTDGLEGSLLEFAKGLPKSSGVAHDTGPESLKWRYAQHPNRRFKFASFSRSGEIRGFLVFEDGTIQQTWSIYDLAARTPSDMRAMLALFILRSLSTPGLSSLRVLLDNRHPTRMCLRRLGFVPRHPDTVFQIRTPRAMRATTWHVTQGDKDT
jgi:hypothetical protein